MASPQCQPRGQTSVYNGDMASTLPLSVTEHERTSPDLLRSSHLHGFCKCFTSTSSVQYGAQNVSSAHAGLIGAGTNNARLAGMLRALSSYYYKEAGMLFLVRVSQGLVHLGKGLLGLAPYHTDGQLLSGAPPASTRSHGFGQGESIKCAYVTGPLVLSGMCLWQLLSGAHTTLTRCSLRSSPGCG